ncbi:hypothetical protein BDK51DRAFT_39123 [Blyttiomyces helicus]|uniref:Uncharacterized protein n=1 Tax=Blyttiomyces helicus TaxID=388810 RepID=A0A4P9WP94_9FUNG|nr:hypothetical protein BDK51DRAFT_39123 [Blyttiomyces helicus]|eukprot:RKO93548.1 hypothetical protein BDK51DRAFT_39123 [Blyttiomyces helicus]
MAGLPATPVMTNPVMRLLARSGEAAPFRRAFRERGADGVQLLTVAEHVDACVRLFNAVAQVAGPDVAPAWFAEARAAALAPLRVGLDIMGRQLSRIISRGEDEETFRFKRAALSTATEQTPPRQLRAPNKTVAGYSATVVHPVRPLNGQAPAAIQAVLRAVPFTPDPEPHHLPSSPSPPPPAICKSLSKTLGPSANTTTTISGQECSGFVFRAAPITFGPGTLPPAVFAFPATARDLQIPLENIWYICQYYNDDLRVRDGDTEDNFYTKFQKFLTGDYR